MRFLLEFQYQTTFDKPNAEDILSLIGNKIPVPSVRMSAEAAEGSEMRAFTSLKFGIIALRAMARLSLRTCSLPKPSRLLPEVKV